MASARSRPASSASSAASSPSTIPRVTISGSGLEPPGLAVDDDDRDHDALGREVAAVTHDEVLDFAAAAAVEERPARGHSGFLACPVSGQAEHVAVLGDEHVVGGKARGGGQARVLGQHPVLAVHRHEVAGPRAPQQLAQVVLAAVARRRARSRVPGWTTSQPRRKRLLMSRETARSLPGMTRAESTTVSPGPAARFAVLAEADHRERGERLALAAGDEDQRALAGVVAVQHVRVEPRAIGEPQEPEVDRHLGVVDHAAAEERHRASVPSRDVGHALHPRDRGGEAGDQDAARGCGPRRPRRRARRRPRRRWFRGPRRWCCRRGARGRRGRPTRRARRGRCARPGGASASILKSPLASTTPAGVSIARARLSSTLWATRIGCTRKGPISTGSPGTRVREVRRRRRAPAGACGRSPGSDGCRRRARAPPAARRRARRCGPRGRG